MVARALGFAVLSAAYVGGLAWMLPGPVLAWMFDRVYMVGLVLLPLIVAACALLIPDRRTVFRSAPVVYRDPDVHNHYHVTINNTTNNYYGGDTYNLGGGGAPSLPGGGSSYGAAWRSQGAIGRGSPAVGGTSRAGLPSVVPGQVIPAPVRRAIERRRA
jgi:hypothetical protein